MIRTFNMLNNKWEGDHKDSQPNTHQERSNLREQTVLAPALQLREIEVQTDKPISIVDLNALITMLDD